MTLAEFSYYCPRCRKTWMTTVLEDTCPFCGATRCRRIYPDAPQIKDAA